MTLSWTQDRLGPICRTAEDCAIVFHAIAKNDEQDLSVVDLPFNYDAGRDVRTLRVGYLSAAFDETGRDADWKRNDAQALDTLRGLGVGLEAFDLPKLPINVLNGILGAESGASFDEFIRAGRDREMTNPQRGNGMRTSRLVPAIEYLQSQRVRAMIMRQFADTVGRFDVYVAPYMNMRAAGAAGRAGGAGREGAAGDAPARSDRVPPPSVIRDHFAVANVCGYPAVSVPTGFTGDGHPTSLTFLGRLYNEGDILSLARAYEERAGWISRRPQSVTA
jgi:Asp-tRNA(Asn)/Glu-tRNA(Gln) amidotransferase A subunit family amidase